MDRGERAEGMRKRIQIFQIDTADTEILTGGEGHEKKENL